MKIKYFKKAFSLTETIIMLTILAIAVASLTPMITKKLANNVEAGTTINGVSHGRYEIYAKEIVEFGSKAYEKSGRETKRAEASVLVFDRLDDLTYKKYASKSPEMNSKGQKSTLYEQIDNAKAYRSPSGDIEYVEFKKNGATKKYPVGGNIIVESSNVIYTEGKIIPGNPDSFEKKSGGIVLPNDNNRIIEGALTKKFNKKSDDNNILWHIDAKNDSADNFEGTVTVIPWEKVISGNKTIVDKPIKKDPITGEYIGTFDPGLGTKSLVLHAVGGGGAGGGLSNIGGAVTPKNATAEELKYMKEILAKRFREIANKNGLSHEANIPIDTLVRIERATGHLHDKQYDDVFTSDDNYIVLNTVDGTITVKADTRNGLIFPSDLLDYTNILGSQTQETDLYDMPIWGNFKTFETGGDRGKPFYAGAVGCGCKGGDGSTYIVDHTANRFWCKEEEFCPPYAIQNVCTSGPESCSVCDSCCGGAAAKIDYNKLEEEFGIVDFASAAKIRDNLNLISAHTPYADTGYKCSPSYHTETVQCVERKCAWRCDEHYFIRGGTYIEETNTSSCPSEAADCKYWSAEFPKATCLNKYPGGIGGAGGSCAAACTIVNKPIELWSVCPGDCPGRTGTPAFLTGTSGVVTLESGIAGRSCIMKAGEHSAHSGGGTGGTPCAQATIGDGTFTGPIAENAHAASSNPATAAQWSRVFGADFVNSFRMVTSTNTIDEYWLCESTCKSRSCGAPGSAGSSASDCADSTGINVSDAGSGNLYNHIYSWTTPFAINQLHYGEAGQPGEYKTTKIAETTGPFTIILGLGGVWTDHKDTINGKWAKGVSGQAKRGLDGTDTIIKMKDRNVLTAKGGKGGTQSLSTHRYDLCYAKKDECKRTDASVTCCDNEIGKRSTKEIFTTASKMSAFENIKALTGNSTIIGIGLGRGGEGAGTRAGVEQLKGLRVFRNASGHNISYSDSQIKKEEGTYKADLANLDAFKNYALAPSGLNFKGGDGAVIITW